MHSMPKIIGMNAGSGRMNYDAVYNFRSGILHKEEIQNIPLHDHIITLFDRWLYKVRSFKGLRFCKPVTSTADLIEEPERKIYVYHTYFVGYKETGARGSTQRELYKQPP